ncbi:hypothetical protein JH06_5472 [Blastocystis sp. subtype 4]|uniref:hypothetical protein n=1 Tax=Blastocystis sp. subtype 4 TaxID=944170 RepID=UPI000711477B|nr:hypothetical protein JH06_5472 [Blastocystis sp. subtype 4]KNB41835.1 hypothetical protein JH06_5472 [Blastocystis sp. subtype 4]|eukprot:XP_014525278.1 hypothetical protein JH06_5472 [Blastocystis sp. subtype 4]
MEVLDNYSDELVQIQEVIEESFKNLCKLWDQIGVFPDNKRSELKSQIVSGSVDAVIRYLNSIYDSELESKNEMEKSIKTKEKAVGELCNKLGFREDLIWNDENGVDKRESKTLSQILAIVTDTKEKLADKYVQRSIDIREKLNVLRSIYDQLGEPVEEVFSNPDDFLLEKNMLCLEDRVRVVEELRVNRIEKTKELRQQMKQFYDTLGITVENAENEVDKIVLSAEDSLPITTVMVNKLKDRAEELHQLIQDRQQTIIQYMVEIQGLWKLLQTPQEDIDAFLANYTASVSNDAIAYVGIEKRL